MRVAIVAESFLPQMNGVVNSVLRVVDHLESRGHDVIVVAPDTPRGDAHAPTLVGRSVPVHLVPAVRVPKVTSLPVGVPMPSMYRALRDFEPDVVHLASPFVVGLAGAYAARRLQIPSVAVFQTDVAGFAESYGLSVASRAAWRYTRHLHEQCDRTLAPSTATMAALAEHDIPRVFRWARGVDLSQFSPRRRDEGFRAAWGAQGRLVVGFVGRLAPEKHVERLASVASDPSVQVVIVGNGPERERLARLMPSAVFTGELRAEALAAAYASFDVFVHPGEHETFCQTIQEAMAAGLPVVAPDAGGPRDLVAAMHTGYLLPPVDFAERLPGVIDVLRDDSLRADFGRSALAFVAGRTWGAVCDELLGHYADVTGRGWASTQLAG